MMAGEHALFVLSDEPSARVVRALLPAIVLAAWFILGLIPYTLRSLRRGPLRDADLEARGDSVLLGIWIRQYFLWVSRPVWLLIVRSGVPANAVTALLGMASGLAFSLGDRPLVTQLGRYAVACASGMLLNSGGIYVNPWSASDNP